MPDIHPTAIVEPGARIAPGATIGPYCLISGHAEIGRDTVLASHVTILGDSRIGDRNRIHANCVIGGEPQDLSYQGTRTRVVIGDDNIIREGVTINRATEKESGETTIGSWSLRLATSASSTGAA
jgi:UDP-N-acetylglucosamine acyltransferase